jgi:hypothetical protein
MIPTILLTIWNKIYGYVIVVAAAVAAFATIYLRGRSDANKETERRVLGKDLENRRVGDAIRDDVGLLSNPAERLRKWQRPGN